MDKLMLVEPDTSYEKQYLDFVSEASADIRSHGMDFYMPISDSISLEEDIGRVLEHGRGIGLPDGWVAVGTFWMMPENKAAIIGVINIRHRLNEGLLFRGGHISYYIRMAERRKGYGRELLRLGLEKCREMGIERVLITCAKSNLGSARVIISNGGLLDSEAFEGEEQFQRYWIDLAKSDKA